MLKEFKEFATRGNIVDLAVGVVIGGAFQSIINSLVSDIIMPAVSIITGKVDFSDMVFTVGSTSIKYGNFITAIVNFLIIAFSIFCKLWKKVLPLFIQRKNLMKNSCLFKSIPQMFKVRRYGT